MSNFLDIIKYGFINAFTLKGRVSRSVYFVYSLTLNTSLSLAQVTLLKADVNPWLVMGSVSLLSIVLGFSIMVRRVHDAGHGWKLYLLFLIPFIGPIIFLTFIFMVDKNDNKYGLFSERKVTSLDKNIVTTIIAILGFFMFISTAVSTGIAAKLTQESFQEVQANAVGQLLSNNLDMIARQAQANAAQESNGLITLDILHIALEESYLGDGFTKVPTQSGIRIEFNGQSGSIDIDESSESGLRITY